MKNMNLMRILIATMMMIMMKKNGRKWSIRYGGQDQHQPQDQTECHISSTRMHQMFYAIFGDS